MSTQRKSWIAVGVAYGSLGVLLCIFIRGGPLFGGWVLISVFEVAILSSLYLLAKWRDELM
jgi:hypothetical protein